MDSYLTKPVELERFETVVKSIIDFWLIKAKLPPPSAGSLNKASLNH